MYNNIVGKAFSGVSSKANELIMDERNMLLPDNYIYISHLDKSWCDPELNATPQFWIIPCYPDEISDTMNSTFNENSALGRTAPVMTYSRSGPRTVQISIVLHREIFDDMNVGISNAKKYETEDYLDALIRALQSIALPKYNLTNKAIEPPIVAFRLANEIFVRGVVTGGIGMTFEKPILYNNRYAQARLSLAVTEVDPYDAETVFKNGGFRGMVNTFKKINSNDYRMGEW